EGSHDAGRLANQKGLAGQSLLQNVEKLIEPVFQKLESIRVGRLRKRALKAVRRHIAGQLVIIPEQPAQDFELLALALTAEAFVALRKPEQKRSRLTEALPVLFKDRDLSHFVDR